MNRAERRAKESRIRVEASASTRAARAGGPDGTVCCSNARLTDFKLYSGSPSMGHGLLVCDVHETRRRVRATRSIEEADLFAAEGLLGSKVVEDPS